MIFYHHQDLHEQVPLDPDENREVEKTFHKQIPSHTTITVLRPLRYVSQPLQTSPVPQPYCVSKRHISSVVFLRIGANQKVGSVICFGPKAVLKLRAMGGSSSLFLHWHKLLSPSSWTSTLVNATSSFRGRSSASAPGIVLGFLFYLFKKTCFNASFSFLVIMVCTPASF